MKSFFIFYAAVIAAVFCLVNTNLDSKNNVIIFNQNETCKVTVKGAVSNANTFEVSSLTYVFEVLIMAQLAYNADVSGIELYQFVTNNTTITIPYGIININTAEVEELQELAGVGPSYAQKIVDYREMQLFSKIEDLINISQSIYTNNAHRITV